MAEIKCGNWIKQKVTVRGAESALAAEETAI
jgi:hypothetical protein